jgi:L-rhamnose-H+ transport protein
MHQVVWVAVLAVILGGMTQGIFAAPMRWTRSWAWENVWLVYSVSALVVIPLAAAKATVPNLFAVYGSVPVSALVVTILFGFGWGVANVMFGLAVARVGMALSFAIVVGLSAALGSLIPLVASTPERLRTHSGLLVLAGVVLTLFGVFLLGSAGRSRERMALDSSKANLQSKTGGDIGGLLLCVMAGVLAPMLNFSFAFGSRIISEATRQGISSARAVNAIWALALAGGFVSNGGYCVILLLKHRSFRQFVKPGTASYWSLGVLMGTLWTAGIFLYGWGASRLGDLGPSVGWPVFQATIVIVSSVVGFCLHEWRGAEPRVVRVNAVGVAVLISAIVVLSIGNSR